jgi:DNA (cytosine-5)-methyltransferase 1
VLSVGSLFSGIGGLEYGLEMTGGFKTVWQVETNGFCQRVLIEHWPDAKRYGDVCEVGAHNLECVDIICGGFPCQDASYALQWHDREGIDGDRTGLWSEMARVVRELRPRYVIVENVTALLAIGFGRVIGDLAEMGYDAEWGCLPASLWGAPHHRERVFCIAYPDDKRREKVSTVLTNVPTAKRRKVQPWDVAGTARMGGTPWESKPPVPGMDVGVPRGVGYRPSIEALGNAVVPQVAEWIGRRILAVENGED